MHCCKFLFFLIVFCAAFEVYGVDSDIKIVLDVDVGTDDAFALIIALRAHSDPHIPIRVLAVTCVAGNTNITNCVRNAHRTLDMMGESNIPVYAGVDEQLVVPCAQDEWHGKDGLGDAEWSSDPVYEVPEQSSVMALIELAKKHPGEITLVALGPLTNLALATKIDPNFASNLKDIYIMGGNIHGVGNADISAEFNFFCDPEAAFVTLNSFKVPIHLVPLETCEKTSFSCDWRRNILGGLQTPASEFMNKIEANLLDTVYCPGGIGSYETYDQMILGALIEPEVVLEEMEHYASVELAGNLTRGMMVVDYKDHIGRGRGQRGHAEVRENSNVNIKTVYNVELYGRVLIWALGGPDFRR